MQQNTQLVSEISPEGMLFVRFTSILSTMVKVPIIAACLLVITLSSFVHYSFGSLRVLDFTVYPDGTTHVFYQSEVDPQDPDFSLKLYGNTTDNFVAQDENGTLLASKIEGNSAIIQTLGASSIKIDYDTSDLVTKNGKTWTFHIDSPSDFSVLLPKNTVIVGMSTYPLNMQIVDDQSSISLPKGSVDINYVFGVLGTSQTATLAIEKARDFINKINSDGIQTPLAAAKLEEANSAFSQNKFSNAEVLANEAKNIAIQEQETALTKPKPTVDNSIILIGGGVAGAAATAVILIKRSKAGRTQQTVQVSQNENFMPPDKEAIFKLKPELRQEDKDIVTFISENGGQVYESDLRKKFLLPRTTMWRAVKRLEREGIVEIEKIDNLNRIRLRKNPEENQA